MSYPRWRLEEVLLKWEYSLLQQLYGSPVGGWEGGYSIWQVVNQQLQVSCQWWLEVSQSGSWNIGLGNKGAVINVRMAMWADFLNGFKTLKIENNILNWANN